MKWTMMLMAGMLALAPESWAVDRGEETPVVLDEVLRGFDALRGGDVVGALRRWTVGGPLEHSETLKGLGEQLRTYREDLGVVEGIHLIRTVPLGQTGRLDYQVIDYNRGPVYARFHLFFRQGRWVAIGLAFDRNPAAVLPERVLDGG